ncbi:MAG: NAD(P)H-hydrate epimerase [Aeromicrobium sp.]|uniref:NAD(P)H-hydrate epimerase n=1 Tax=Aeromicrobium sp. TaxID=1871063 RepID=UPI0026376798|nr:NAD(P)H-hydrate epimerase [Aeromicrobium sp.]MDF1704572.1 NAD(P)H-hydrate epimerase [Aeromicrobium sp.]
MLCAHDASAVRAAEESAARTSSWDDLMQQAAAALADVLLAELPAGRTPVVLVGPGNNGGDALFAAARLRERGLPVNVCLLEPDRAHAAGLAAARAAGAGEVDEPHGHAVVVDGVLGIGARPGLTGRAAAWAEWQVQARPFTVAVDVPSGIGVDDGTAPGSHLVADRTVTFGTYKPGLLLGPAADAAGTVTLAPIGLGPHLGAPVVETLTIHDHDLLAPAVPHGHAHKYTRGVLGIRAGSAGYPGAAHLAVAGGQSGPAGYVRFVGHPDVAQQVVLRAPEVVAGRGRVQAWVVGPGGGDDTDVHVAEARADELPTVLDATALQHLPDRLRVHDVMTPHAGELATLLDVDREAVEADPWGHARRAADHWGATVLLKGHRTLVVSPGRPARVNLSGTAWLGTAGSGDVLSGFVGALLASGLDPLDAASVGAFLHGAAGVRANPGGPVTATAVAAALPGVVADFLAGRLSGERDW